MSGEPQPDEITQPLGFCYADHDPPETAVEVLRLNFPGQPPRTVAACASCAAVLRQMAL